MGLFDEEYDLRVPIQSLELDTSEPSLTIEELGLDDALNDNLLDVSFGKRKTSVTVNHHAKWF